MTKKLNQTLPALLLAICLTPACSRETAPEVAEPAAPEPQAQLRVADIQLGSQIGADKRVTQAATTFQPNDTIYASVITEGSAPSATLSARWTYQDGQVVNESEQSISPSGPAATEFYISKPDGWPTGSYQVEIRLNGEMAGNREFQVQ